MLIAAHRQGRRASEEAQNTRADVRGVFRSEAEWTTLVHAAGLQLLAAGNMFATNDTRVFYIAQPTATAATAAAAAP